MNESKRPYNVLLHLGAPKCGSSALQAFLSDNPILEKEDGSKIFYIAYENFFRSFLVGDEVRYVSGSSPYKYLASYVKDRSNIQNISSLDLFSRYGFNKSKDILLLSSEQFFFFGFSETKAFLESFFGDEEIRLDLLLYIRPQVSLINSAWWQWAAWREQSLDEFVESCGEGWFNYMSQVEQYYSLSTLKKFHIRILPQDIVADFCSAFNICNNKRLSSDTKNKSLPGVVLRLYQKYKFLRPSEHASEIDFSIERHLGHLKSPTPWVLSEEHVHKIKLMFSPANKTLFEQLDCDQKSIMEDDDRWWAPSVSHDLESSHCVNIESVDLEDVAKESLACIHDLDSKILLSQGCLQLFMDLFGEMLFDDKFVHKVNSNNLTKVKTLKILLAKHCTIQSKRFAQKGDYDAALEKANESIKFFDANPHTYHLLGNLLRTVGDLCGAEKAQRKAIELAPNIPGPYHQLSHIYGQKGDLVQAISKVRVAISLSDGNPHYHLDLCVLLIKKGDIVDAENELQKAVALNPDLPGPHFQLSQIYNQKGLLDRAIEEAREAIYLSADNAHFHSHLGVLLKKRGDIAGAESEQQEAVALNPDLPGPHFLLSQIYNQKGLFEKAVEEAREAISLKADNPHFHLHLGILLMQNGDFDDAEKELEKVIEINRSIPGSHFHLSIIYDRKGQLDKALEKARTTVDLKGDNARFLLHLGKLLEKVGDLDGAEKARQKAAEVK